MWSCLLRGIPKPKAQSPNTTHQPRSQIPNTKNQTQNPEHQTPNPTPQWFGPSRGPYKDKSKVSQGFVDMRTTNLVLETTTFGSPSDGVCFFGAPALINHDCAPNCIAPPLLKDVMLIGSVVPIKKGEEITISYNPGAHTLDPRP